jgi:cytochrome b
MTVAVNLFNDTGSTHRLIGYICVALVLLRMAGGFVLRNADAKLRWPGTALVRQHLRDLLARRAKAHPGHNPLGQYAVYLMWLLMLLLGLSGWISRTDALWGEDWPVLLHHWLADALLGMVCLHLAAIAALSAWFRTNLVGPMLLNKCIKSDNNDR